MYQLRIFYRKRLEKVIKHDPLLAENKLLNQNKISEQILVNFFVKIVKLGLIIFHICYFLGLVFFIVADIYYAEYNEWEAKKNLTLSIEEYDASNQESFFGYYDLYNNSPTRNTIIGLYFAFTTLSTVGFGDFTPRGDFERAFGAFVLISGVAMFSYLMGSFIEILSTY